MHKKVYPIVTCYCVRDGEVAIDFADSVGEPKPDGSLFNLNNPEEAAAIAKSLIANKPTECVYVFGLNSKAEIIYVEQVSQGDIAHSIMEPASTYRSAIIHNCAAIIMAHNHPSGSLTPSRNDIESTTKLKDAGELLGIRLLDHIIVSSEGYCSMREKGVM